MTQLQSDILKIVKELKEKVSTLEKENQILRCTLEAMTEGEDGRD